MNAVRRLLVSLISVLVTASMLLVAAPLAPQPAKAQSSPDAVAPTVLQFTPAPGEEQPLEAPVQITFDQPMQPATVEAAFAIEPRVAGGFSWPLPHVMQWKPRQPLERATRYTVTLSQDALSDAGIPLREPASFRIDTVGYLESWNRQPRARGNGSTPPSTPLRRMPDSNLPRCTRLASAISRT